MEQQPANNETRDEERKEFQLQRMILFSDAVFAIGMTLMAMDIKLPKEVGGIQAAMAPFAILHLMPVIISYAVSFVFIGGIWYEHLKIFSLLKDYDRGLVIRNLFLLFLIGFFPFSSSFITHVQGGMIAIFFYFGIIFICLVAQYLLYHYIVITKPDLTININRPKHLLELKKRRVSLIGFLVAAIFSIGTFAFFDNPVIKGLASLWVAVFAIAYAIWVKKIKNVEQNISENKRENVA